MKRMSQLQLKLKIIKKNGNVLIIRTTKKRRFLSKLQAVEDSEVASYQLRVTNGYFTNTFDEKVTARNEGEYVSLKELMHALSVFTDPKEVQAIEVESNKRGDS